MAVGRELMMLLVLSIFSVQVFSQSDYDFVWLVQQWPPAVCRGRRCAHGSLQIFTIHGLWPQKNYGPSPVDCPGAPLYDKNLIKGKLRTDLNHYWPDVVSGNNDRFWALEWNKHGTCSFGTFNQVQYFTFSVEKREQYDLVAILAAANIIPNGFTYSLVDIKSAIRENTGRQPGVRCDVQTKTKLLEIVLCFDKPGTNLIDCNRDRCSANVVW